MIHSIVFVDDEVSLVKNVKEFFADYNMYVFSDAIEALQFLNQKSCSVLIADYKMPKMNGIELLQKVKPLNAYQYGILFTAFADKELLETALNENLVHLLIEKPYRLKELKIEIDKAIKICQEEHNFALKNEAKDLELKELKRNYSFSTQQIIGLENGLKHVYKEVKSVCKHNVNVFITGETGTGKEVIARLIHDLSGRKNGNFIKINCATIPENLLESELFGHTKNAFTGANTEKKGKIELADMGTLFLDEIAEMPIHLQAKLLTVIQDKKFERIGSTIPISIDFRLITATNRPIEDAINNNTFRQDLYYRTAEYEINLPPLRQREKDIPELAETIIQTACNEFQIDVPNIHPKVIELLTQHNWPGNIRELQNMIKRAILSLNGSRQLRPEHFNFMDAPTKNRSTTYNDAIHNISDFILEQKLHLKQIEKDILKMIINKNDNSIPKASKTSGIAIDKFYRHCKYSSATKYSQIANSIAPIIAIYKFKKILSKIN